MTCYHETAEKSVNANILAYKLAGADWNKCVFGELLHSVHQQRSYQAKNHERIKIPFSIVRRFFIYKCL